MQTVQTFFDPWDAHLLRMRLDVEGIPAFIANDQHVWNNWPVANALGGVRVQVPDEYVPLASEVWRRYRGGTYERELAEMFGELDALHCQRCGSTDIKRRPTVSEIVFGIAVTAFGACAKVRASRRICQTCGKRWLDET